MASQSDIITRWVRETRNEYPKYLRPSASNIRIDSAAQYAPIYSYGRHFELGRWMSATDDHAGYWLLNGDTYSVSTARHQSELRSAVKATGDPVLILPFTPLASAGIDRRTIVPIEITDDRQVPDPVTGPLSILPDLMVTDGTVIDYYLAPSPYRPGEGPEVTDHGDGTFTWHRTRHVLGESVFTAQYRTRGWGNDRETAYFLSGFDAQESRPHYFLAQLPAGAEPVSVKDAFESLRPAVVTDADNLGVQVTRQGDVFAVPSTLTTRELTKLGGERVKGARLLGLSHIATEAVVTPKGNTYARGTLRHRPEGWGRTPEHRNQRMADGKTWHLIVKNTVPVDEHGQSRAWSRPGMVD